MPESADGYRRTIHQPPRPTSRAAGLDAEDAVARALTAAGWRVLARNVRVGRLELDIIAVDPGPPARLVAVEVRSRRRRDYGLAEETVDGRKLGRLRAAVGGLLAIGALPDGRRLPALPPAIDVVAVEPGPDGRRMRHVRNVTA
ncbi:MAG TPA: YraN family protein [Candidatus Limnocylindrales bacterium]|nr:YraN family protein [Candidatus Limnocylindrales bacterium]